MKYNKDLPLKPDGFTQRLTFHMSYNDDGRGGSASRYVWEIRDSEGKACSIVKESDTGGKNPYCGFIVDGDPEETCFTKWADAAAKWNEIRARKAKPQ